VLLTSFSTTLPLRIVVVVVSLTTVPSGWVVVTVLVVEVVELVVTGAGGIGAVVSVVVVVEEQPTARVHAAAAIRTIAKGPKRKLILKGCRGGGRNVNNEHAPEPLVSKHWMFGSLSQGTAPEYSPAAD
jgi:hypothetical protein